MSMVLKPLGFGRTGRSSLHGPPPRLSPASIPCLLSHATCRCRDVSLASANVTLLVRKSNAQIALGTFRLIAEETLIAYLLGAASNSGLRADTTRLAALCRTALLSCQYVAEQISGLFRDADGGKRDPVWAPWQSVLLEGFFARLGSGLPKRDLRPRRRTLATIVEQMGLRNQDR